jgi:hypothetical protein
MSARGSGERQTTNHNYDKKKTESMGLAAEKAT